MKSKVQKGKKTKIFELWCITMIDPATGWFEMVTIKDKEAITVANKVEQTWLTRYPRPSIIQYDKGREFMAEFAAMIKQDYGIKKKGSLMRSPQANSILERVHQMLGNIIRSSEIHLRDNIDENNPWSGVLAATMFALRATYHTTLQAMPMQVTFGRDAILNTKFEADWQAIKRQKQK